MRMSRPWKRYLPKYMSIYMLLTLTTIDATSPHAMCCNLMTQKFVQELYLQFLIPANAIHYTFNINLSKQNPSQ